MYDRSVEQTLLGAMALNHDAVWKAAANLNPEDWYYPEHQAMFKAMVHNAQAGLANEPLAVRDALRSAGVEPDLAYLGQVLTAPAATANIPHYIDQIQTLSRQRQMEIHLKRGLNGLDKAKPDEVASHLIEELIGVTQQRRSESVPLMTAVKGALEHLDARLDHGPGLMGLPTGFVQLDEMTSGFQRGDLVILAARPSIGKTAMALSMTRHAARQGKRVAYFSLEMDQTQLAQRMLAIESDVPLSLIRTGHGRNGQPMEDGEGRNLEAGIQRLKAYNIVFNDQPQVTPATLRAELNKLHREQPLDLVVIDYLQLMSGGDDEYTRVSEASRHLKLLAREFKVPVVALSQLNRECEGRPDKRPQLSDLRASGSLEQDADLVMLLYRPGHYGLEQVGSTYYGSDQTEILLVKHRNGPTGVIPLYWLAHTAEFQSC